ncbi:probable E3 ubiquitin-protein ligase ARI2 [Typha latifolia]|uniref:probable E3 ubiquitin-protein ligase ARI2 n=1 Tax=Typha latifolia TaxID=4733 RepID=UPI003C2BFBE5
MAEEEDYLTSVSDFECNSEEEEEVITKESLLAAQKEDLCKVMELLAIKEQHARAVLIHNRWKMVKVHDMIEKKGRERLCLEAGVVLATEDDAGGVGGLPTSSTAVFTCNVCFDDVSPSQSTTMDCGHTFCNDCWTQHFIARINDGESRDVRCIAHKCNAVCDETIIRNLVGERHPEIASCFDRFLLGSYIEDNDNVKWCPRIPNCGNAIRVEGDTYCEVECSCGFEFCFNCSREAHSPCPCLLWDLWVKKWHDESETANWIVANAKPCPKCRSIVEKNGGCNAVKCRCGQYFCWLCGGATGNAHTFTRIEGHSCNSFTDEEMEKIKVAGHKSRRYMHYFKRYKEHVDSSKLESELRKTLMETVAKLEDENSITVRDFSWVMTGLQRLLRSRRVLSYTYPFAFYMFGDEFVNGESANCCKENKQSLFEHQQQQLERYVDKLSMYLENFHPVTDGQILQTRFKLTNLSNTIDTSCERIYQCIEEELLPLLPTPEFIAPYISDGPEKAMKSSTFSIE